ncbi:S8 family peptidase [Inconstantimicrobium mannanitabidum]|uniref:Uncharacterized protein n=1 Tax=Inconstantimicrobium mannanitabidum TaxID=1604901 RepID=A0ACB5RES3_9CLOT|nr:S8 family peptidase [Clostridium sp. TW13]GKX67762.1 hypothetical protein rsdtw13_30200 [Clostridium sp. TW13]
MINIQLQKRKLFYSENTPNFLVEYRGNLKEQIDKVSYAVGDIITETIAVIAVAEDDLDRLLKDVPAIIFVDFRAMFVLEDTAPADVDNINKIKINPYLDLTGTDIIIGLVDTGIDYLNQEFIREDGTSKILSIWDQSIISEDQSVYMGSVYSNQQINAAIAAQKNKQDPYSIVPSKDELGHGTEIAGIIGARGATNKFKGIAQDASFVIVKLFPSAAYQKTLRENKVPPVPVYNTSEILAGLEFLRQAFLKYQKPMVICLCVGTTEGSHDGTNLISRYFSSLGSYRGLVLVAGTGNEGSSQGHASGIIRNVHDVNSIELKVPAEMEHFIVNIWLRRPNRASLNVVSPTGEESKIIESKINKVDTSKFVYVDTTMTVKYYTPEHFTGHELIHIHFDRIKPGIWTFKLIGDYIVSGRYDIWLSPRITLPENTEFLQPDPFETLTIPGTAINVVTVTALGDNNFILPNSGKGYNANGIVNPNIAVLGQNIITTSVGGTPTTISGSSAATAIVAGACALLLEWGIVDNNDKAIFSKKIISYLEYGASRNPIYKFPNRDIGYGFLDLLETFNIISRSYTRGDIKNFTEYSINNLFIRIPLNIMEDY